MTEPDPPAPTVPGPLAAPDDLALVSLGAIGQQEAKDLLSIASDQARQFCGWIISEWTYDLTLDSAGDRIITLPAMHVTDVDEISIKGVALGDESFTWSSSGVVESCGRWPRGRRIIGAKFTAGYDPIPRDIVGAVIGLAARTAATRGGFTSQRIGSLALGGFGAGMAAGLDDPESVLARYRLP